MKLSKIKKKPIMLVSDVDENPLIDQERRPSFMGIPKCVESGEAYKTWKIHARSAEKTPLFRRMRFCHDCTPEYQCEMRMQGKCENKEVSFIKVINKQDEEYGGVMGAFLKKEIL